MAARKFAIPSISEMENSKREEYKVKTLFDKHKQSAQPKNIEEQTSNDSLSNTKPDGTLIQSQPKKSMVTASQANSHSVGEPNAVAKGEYMPKSSQRESATSTDQCKNGTTSTGIAPNVTSVSPNRATVTKDHLTTTGSPNRPSGSHVATGISPNRAVKTYSLLVNTRQRGNPLLKHVRSVPWEFGDIVADYEMGSVMCALFLSLRYHNLNPSYIHERLKLLGQSYDLRVLLVQVDTKDPHHALKELARICLLADCTLILAWSPEEAARYLETYKAFEKKPPDMIMEKQEVDYVSRIQDVLTSGRKVNRTDALTLLSTFGGFEKIVRASEEELSFCPGLGVHKAKRFKSLLNEPFLKLSKRAKVDANEQETKS